jgi:TonB family protein
MPSNPVVGLLRPFPAGFAKGAYRTGPGMRPPALQHAARARYPDDAPGHRAAMVEVLAVIDEDGDVTPRVLAAPEPREPFEREALAAVLKYVFEPGAIDGRPVPVVVTLLVELRPPGSAPPPARIVGGTTDPPPGVAARFVGRAEPASPQLLRPLPISKVYPDFTAELLPANVSGRVEMLVIVRPDGTVDDLEVTRRLTSAVDDAAVDVVRRWVFEPAIKGSRPVPVLFSAFLSVNEVQM